MTLSIGILGVLYIGIYLYSNIKKDNSIVDIVWGIGISLIAIIEYLESAKSHIQTILLVLILLWGIRIVWHISARKMQEKAGEDPRYAKWRLDWKGKWYFQIRSFLQIYLLQFLLLLGVSSPIFVIMNTIQPQGRNESFILLTLGILISLSGLVFETIADNQLRTFIANKKPGEIYTNGLYRYSRHPNYFGESVFWFGIGVISSSTSIYGFLGWILITGLLVGVSGIPIQEKRYENRPGWKEYKEKTSAFIPWFPK